MGWIVFEALLALAVMLAAAWWTFSGRREPDEPLDDGVPAADRAQEPAKDAAPRG